MVSDKRPAPNDERQTINNLVGRYGLVILLIGLVISFSIAMPDSFATVTNFRSILDNQSVIVLLALAAMLPLIVGEFDLSVAAVLGLTQTFSIGLAANQGLPTPIAVVLGLIVGLLVGIANGLVVVGLKVNSFVATLASATVIGGIVLWYTGGAVIYDGVPQSLMSVATRQVAGIPLSVYYAFGAALTMWFVLTRLAVGRRLYAVGGNRRAAELAGLHPPRFIVLAFACSGLLAAVAGIVLGARLGSAQASSGDALLLPAYAGAFLGATAITPGRFNAIGTLISVYALSVAVAGLQQLGAPQWVTSMFNGAVLIVAVAASGYANRSKLTRARRAQLARIRERPDAPSDEPTAAATT